MNRPSSSPLLVARQIKKSFYKKKKEISVLKGVDLTVHPGEMLALTGRSGAGKSTLLHILGSLELPTSGNVEYVLENRKYDLVKGSEAFLSDFRNRNLGFVFQFHYLLPEFSALENVMMPALIAGYPRKAAHTQARELLEFVGLAHRFDHRPAELSGGEQQRVAIARSVIMSPKLLLADELTGNLDTENSEKIIELLTRLNQTTGVSVVLVTHDEQIAQRMHRIIQMRDGYLVQ